MIYGLPFVLGEFGSAAGEVRAPAAGIDGAYRPMAAEYTWWTREFRVSHRGSEDAGEDGEKDNRAGKEVMHCER